MRSWISPFLIACLSIILPLTAAAENSTREAGFTVHHNAVPSAMLTPEIASRYGLIRSKYRGLLNVSVIKDAPGTTGQAVTARVNAQATNLTSQVIDIPMREVRDGDAIYYLGEFPIIDRERLRFSLEVQPVGVSKTIKAGLQQQFFID
jgi:hypothetical protein